ncbi:hypothetical protein TNCV_1716811 [Trichonephila clavipes]|nr:hypothetical protein TNCV_1716811 [Trichonephila clavipes]
MVTFSRIILLIPGKDGHVRVARVKTETGELVRPVQRLYNLELQELDINLPKNRLILSFVQGEAEKWEDVANEEEGVCGGVNNQMSDECLGFLFSRVTTGGGETL